jgi:hypothetical protein
MPPSEEMPDRMLEKRLASRMDSTKETPPSE